MIPIIEVANMLGHLFGCFPHEQRHYSEMPKAR